ncbi:MAG: tetratricopeptide repeat protein [Bacteroidia bacterium]
MIGFKNILAILIVALIGKNLSGQEIIGNGDVYQICNEWFDQRQTKEIRTIDEQLDSLESIISLSNADTHEVNLLIKAGKLKWWLEDHRGQLEFAKKARKISLALGYNKGVAMALIQIRNAYIDLNEVDSFTAIEHRLLDFCDSIGTPLFNLYKFRTIAKGFDRVYEYDSALVYYNKALDLAISLNIESLVSNLYSSISYDYYYTDQLEQENKYIALNLKSLIKQNDLINIMSALNDLGTHYGMVPLIGLSTKSYLLSLKICNKIEFQSFKAALYSNLADNYELMNENAKALQYYSLAETTNLEVDNKNWLGYNYRGFTKVYLKTNKLSEALKYARMAAKLSRQTNNKYDQLIDTLTIGKVLFKLGEFQNAFSCFSTAHKTTQNSKNESEFSWVKSELAELFFELSKLNPSITLIDSNGDPIETKTYGYLAQKYLEEALENDSNLEGFIEAKSKRQKLMAEIYFSNEDYKKGYLSLAEYQRLNDSVFNIEKNKEINIIEFKQKAQMDSVKRQEEIRIKKEIELKKFESLKRENRIQYSLTFIIVLLLATTIVVLSRFKISLKLAQGLIFFFFILIFEFLLVVLDPWVDSISNDKVGYKIAINTILALLLFAVHQISEKKIKIVLLQQDKLV